MCAVKCRERALWLGVLCVLVLAGPSWGSLDFHWDFLEAEGWVYDGVGEVAHDVAGWPADPYDFWMEVCAESGPDGEADAELGVQFLATLPGITVVELETAVNVYAHWDDADVGNEVNTAEGYAYFQLVVTVSDRPYAFSLVKELEEPSNDWESIIQYDHFVNFNGPDPDGDGEGVLQPGETYLLWGAVHYEVSSLFSTLDFGGPWPFSASASTDAWLTLEEVPEPGALALLALGGIVMRRRRQR